MPGLVHHGKLNKGALRLGSNLRWVVFLLGLSLISEVVLSENRHCDANLQPQTGHPYAYKRVNGHCEGVYRQLLGGTLLRLASFTEFFEDFDPNSGKNLFLEWKGQNKEVRLKAQSLKRRIYYRMDSVRPRKDSTYSWSPTFLSALGLGKTDLGIVAWSLQSVSGSEQRIYLPIRVRQIEEPSSGEGYRMVVVPLVELKEVYITVSRLDENGQVLDYLKEAVPLGYGYYPASRGIEYLLSGFETTGLYGIEVGAVQRDGAVAALQFLIFHSGA